MNPNEVQRRLLRAEGRIPEQTLQQAAEAAMADASMDLGGLLHRHGFLDGTQLDQLRRQTAHALAGLAALPADPNDSGPPVRRPASLRAAAIRDSTARSGDDSNPALPDPEPAWPPTGSGRQASHRQAPDRPVAGGPSGSDFPVGPPGPPQVRHGPSSASLPIPPKDPLAEYEIRETLGAGGMGTVYAAHHPRYGEVALKVLKPGRGTRSDRHVARFQREIEVVRSLQHPNIVPLLDAAVLADRAYIAMPRLGESLEQRLERDGPLPIREAIRLTAALARALAAAHFADILHRDMKPANVLFDDRGRPFLADFGLALVVDDAEERLSRTGETLGTLAYMPPEQLDADREKVDVRADIYALGATLYEMLAGRPPFVEQTQTDLFVKIAGVRAPTLRENGVNAPQEVEDLVARCLEKEPDARWPTAEFLADACDELLLLDLESEPAAPARRAGRAALAIALIGALVAAGALGRSWMLDRQREARRLELTAELDRLEPALAKLENAALTEGRRAISRVRLDRLSATQAKLAPRMTALSSASVAERGTVQRFKSLGRRLIALRSLSTDDKSPGADAPGVVAPGVDAPGVDAPRAQQLSIEPSRSAAERWSLARFELAAGRIEPAATRYLELARAQPGAAGMIEEAGRALLLQGRPEMALQVLEAADGKLVRGRFPRELLRVRALFGVGRERSAEELWRETLAVAPKETEALDLLLDTACEFGSLELPAEMARCLKDRGLESSLSPAAQLFLEVIDGTVWSYPCRVLALLPELESRSKGHPARLAWLPLLEAIADSRHEKIEEATDRLRRFYQEARRSNRLRRAWLIADTLLPELERAERGSEVDELCGGLIARLSARLANRKDEARWCREAIARLRSFRADCTLERAALRVYERGSGAVEAGDSAARADYRAALALYDLPMARRRLAVLTVLAGDSEGKLQGELRSLLEPLEKDRHPNTLYARAALLKAPARIHIGDALTEAVERAYADARNGLHSMNASRDLTTLHVWIGSLKRSLRAGMRERLRARVVAALLSDPFAISGLVCAAEICRLDRAIPAFDAFAKRVRLIDPFELRLHQLFKDIDRTSRWKRRLAWLAGLRRTADSERAEILNALAQIHESLGEVKEAERVYRQALAIDPHHVGAMTQLAGLARRRDDAREARRLAERCAAVRESLRAMPAIQAAFVLQQFDEVKKAVARHRGRVPRNFERTLAFFAAGSRLMQEPDKDENWLGFEGFVPDKAAFSDCFYIACSIGGAEVHRRRLEALNRELREPPCDRISRYMLSHAAMLHEYALALRTDTLTRAKVESLRRRMGSIRALQPDLRGSWGTGILMEVHAGAFEDAIVDCDRMIRTTKAEPASSSVGIFLGVKAFCLLRIGDRPRALETLISALEQNFKPAITDGLGLTDNTAFRQLLAEARSRR